MVMTSHVDIINAKAQAVTEEGRDFDVMLIELGIPRITGTFLFNKGKINLVSSNGETLIIASPIEFDDSIRVHLAFGGIDRRICHTLTIDGFEQIVSHLNTVLALAKLEASRHAEDRPNQGE